LGGLPGIVSFNHSTRVQFNTSLLAVEAITVRVSANREQENVRFNLENLISLPSNIQSNSIFAIIDAINNRVIS